MAFSLFSNRDFRSDVYYHNYPSYLLFGTNYPRIIDPTIISNIHHRSDNRYLEREISYYSKPKEHIHISGLWRIIVPNESIFNLKKVCYHLFARFPKSPNNKTRQMSDVIELGVSLLSLEKAEPKYEFHSSSSFGVVTEIYRFISWEMAKLTGQIPKMRNTEMDEIMDNIQITIRRYKKGQGIGPHVDRTDKFTDRIFTVVVHSIPNKGLIFTRQDGCEYQVPEVDGLIEIQTGDSRYKFTHKLNPLEFGNRISITWRFFREDYLSKWRPSNLKRERVTKLLEDKRNYYLEQRNFSFFEKDCSWL